MNLKITILIALLIISAITSVWWLSTRDSISTTNKLSISREQITPTPSPKPLLKYAIPNLKLLQNEPKQPIQIKKIITSDLENNLYTLLFSYQSQDKTISGALTLQLPPTPNTTTDTTTDTTTSPSNNPPSTLPIIIMLRGYVPLEIYSPGMGTKSAAAALAKQGYTTLAPDFLGFGESDPEPSDTWEARFIKPLNVIDLLNTLKRFPQLDLSTFPELPVKTLTLDPDRIGIWAHSNGGQIAVGTLEALEEPIPTTLWAPVLAPFPYSILYFSDEYADEGKETRKYISMFEENYDVFDFSLTQHLDRLHGPIQIHHGGRDDSALLSWSEEFLDKVDLENQRRQAEGTQSADLADAPDTTNTNNQIEPIKIIFYRYPNADHNLQPNWEQAMQRDVEFFGQFLNFSKN